MQGGAPRAGRATALESGVGGMARGGKGEGMGARREASILVGARPAGKSSLPREREQGREGERGRRWNQAARVVRAAKSETAAPGTSRSVTEGLKGTMLMRHSATAGIPAGALEKPVARVGRLGWTVRVGHRAMAATRVRVGWQGMTVLPVPVRLKH